MIEMEPRVTMFNEDNAEMVHAKIMDDTINIITDLLKEYKSGEEGISDLLVHIMLLGDIGYAIDRYKQSLQSMMELSLTEISLENI